MRKSLKPNSSKKSNRIDKVNSLIQHVVGPALLITLQGHKGIVTITKVQTSRDMRWAKIWVSVVDGNDGEILDTIRKNMYDIQGELNRQLETKIVPRLSFHLDTSGRYAEHISQIFKQIEDEKKDIDGQNTDAE